MHIEPQGAAIDPPLSLDESGSTLDPSARSLSIEDTHERDHSVESTFDCVALLERGQTLCRVITTAAAPVTTATTFAWWRLLCRISHWAVWGCTVRVRLRTSRRLALSGLRGEPFEVLGLIFIGRPATASAFGHLLLTRRRRHELDRMR